jgi:hypothetical protein
LVLRDMEGLTDEEVAEITGLRSGTVRVRLHRARLFVRKQLIKGLKPRSGRAGVVGTELLGTTCNLAAHFRPLKRDLKGSNRRAFDKARLSVLVITERGQRPS